MTRIKKQWVTIWGNGDNYELHAVRPMPIEMTGDGLGRLGWAVDCRGNRSTVKGKPSSPREFYFRYSMYLLVGATVAQWYLDGPTGLIL